MSCCDPLIVLPSANARTRLLNHLIKAIVIEDSSRVKNISLLHSGFPDGSTKITSFDAIEPHPKRIRRTSYSLTVAQTWAEQSLSRCPVTEMQRCLVRSTQFSPGHNVIEYIETHRTDRIPELKRAWMEVLGTEELFNKSFKIDGSEIYLEQDRGRTFIWKEITVDNEVCTDMDVLEYVAGYLSHWTKPLTRNQTAYRQEVENPLEITAPESLVECGFRVITLQESPGYEGKSAVIWRVHHAIIDAASCALVRSRVRLGDRAQTQPQMALSFTSFSLQLQSLQKQGRESATAFWAQQIKDHPSPALSLPLPLPSNIPFDNRLGTFWLQFELDKLKEYCRRAKVTVASLFYAAWGLVLARYTASDHVCFGVVFSGRSLPIAGVETVVGPTINTLPFYISIDAEATVEQYVSQVFASLVRLTSFQWSEPDHGFSRNFSSAVNVRLETPPALTGDSFEPIEHPYYRVVSDFPLHIEVGNCGRACLSYNTQTFFAAHIGRVGTMFAAALDAIIDKPGKTVGSCLESIIGNQQVVQLARMGNWSSGWLTSDSIQDDLISLFSRAAEKYPTKVAIERGPHVLTYAELHEMSSSLANYLLTSCNIRPDDVICVHADGSVYWIVAIYAVLKAGAIYCPLDERLPDITKRTNFAAAGARLFLVGNTSALSSRPAPIEPCLSIEELLARMDPPVLEARQHVVRPNADAYICFTSGSTGKPKGVICRHNGLVSFQNDIDIRLQARPGSRIAQIMSPGFDGSIHEIFSALSYGATLVLKDPSKPFKHLQICDAAILTPSLAEALDPNSFPDLKTVYFVGEAVSQSLCDTWASLKQVFNMYGPTETTCGATIKRLIPRQLVTLGIPCASTRLYVLDNQQKLAPWGTIGEIYIAGVQVAAGYVGRPEETARRFLPDSINPQYARQSMYKTGDRAYWNEDRELSFIGRVDRQVKLQGFRVDLGDVEARMIMANKRCTAAAVVCMRDHLVALVQPADLDLDDFGARIREHLPAYAVPRYIKSASTFPVTPIGKLDYKAIAVQVQPAFEPLSTTICQRTHTVETIRLNAIEETIISELKAVAGLQHGVEIDLESSLDDIGGNSILALSFQRRLSRSFKRPIPISTILETRTIKTMVEHIALFHFSQEQRSKPTHCVDMVLGDQGVAPIEAEWWQKYQQKPNCGKASFNVTYACRLPVSLDQARFIAAWDTSISRHPILSSRYRWDLDSQSLVRHYAQQPPACRQVAAIDVHHEVNVPFHLEAGEDLIRVSVSRTHMLVVVSHIICDLTTLNILLRDVAETYYGIELKPVGKTHFQTTRAIPAASEQLSFWSDYLAGAPCVSDSRKGRTLFKQNSRTTWSGTSHVVDVRDETHLAMRNFCSAHKITMHQLVLAAVALALQFDSEDCDIVLGAPYLNRPSEEDMQVVGLFLEPLPIRIRYPLLGLEMSRDKSDVHPTNVCSFISAVQQSCRAALSHAMPWHQLLSHLGIGAKFPNHPLFDVMVTFHEPSQEVEFPVEGIEFLPTWTEGAKFCIMAEFTARSSGSLSMRLEYSDECLDETGIHLMANLVLEAIEALVVGDDYPVISNRLKSVPRTRVLEDENLDVEGQ